MLTSVLVKALGSFVLGHEKATAKLDCHCDCNWIARLVDMFRTASPRSSPSSSTTFSPSHSSSDPGIMPYFCQPLVPVCWLSQSLSSEDNNVEESQASSCHPTAVDNSGTTANAAVPVPVSAVSVTTWLLLIVALLLNVALQPCAADQDAKRLYEDLLSEYNRLIRPVGNNSDRLTVKLGLKLSQLIDVNLKNQIMTTNVWVEQEWFDYKLKWDPEEYGGVKTLHVPSENIWLPDIVLYNNADGNYEITIMTKAILRYDGTVTWKPPAIYKSSCELDMTHFPFDYQRCFMKFGSWTYDGSKVDLQHLHQMPNSKVVEVGIDLAEYYLSVEWDILEVPAQRNEKTYSCCVERYPDIFFNITLRRKTLFYTVNLIIPCVGISFLSVLVFYLPSESGEKMSLCVSILLSLTVFFLLLAEIIPPTSLTVPLLGKYLLFTMTMVTCSVIASTTVCSFHFRSPSTHRMAPWVRRVFIDFLPKVLFIQRPKRDDEDAGPGGETNGGTSGNGYGYGFRLDTEMHLPTRGTEISIIPVGVHDHLDYEIPPLPESKLKPAGSTISHSPSHKRTRHNESDEGAIGISVVPSSTLLIGGGDAAEGGQGTTPASATSTIARRRHPPEMDHVIEDVRFIGQHLKNNQTFEGIIEDWKFVAMVLDRLFLWIFAIASIAGTAAILLEAPSLYDTTQPIDLKYSKIAQAKLQKLGLLGHDLGLL